MACRNNKSLLFKSSSALLMIPGLSAALVFETLEAFIRACLALSLALVSVFSRSAAALLSVFTWASSLAKLAARVEAPII